MLLVYVITRLYFIVILESILPTYKKRVCCKTGYRVVLAAATDICSLRLLIASFCFVLGLISCFVQ